MSKQNQTGDVFIWLSGLSLGFLLIVIAGMLLLIISKGTEYYIPQKIVEITTKDNRRFLGYISAQYYENNNSDESQSGIKLKVANRDDYGYDFIWLDRIEISTINKSPKNVYVVERLEFGDFYGRIKGVSINDEFISYRDEKFDSILSEYQIKSYELREAIQNIEKSDIGNINYEIDLLKKQIKKLDFEQIEKNTNRAEEIKNLEKQVESYNKKYFQLRSKTDSLLNISNNYKIHLLNINNQSRVIPLIYVYDIYSPNSMNLWDKFIHAISKIITFIIGEPRESNTEGGIFPAIFGTVMMVMLMSLAAVPLGVLTALYLREYAKQGFLVRVVRIAVNNLAGVPSIVFGIFGLGFFIYTLGGTIDDIFYPENLPAPTWGTGGILWASLTLALLTVPVVIVSTEEALDSIPLGIREASIALGATKWQTTYKIILPAAAPGIMTGVILAMARGAGEVAPLMITGVVKLAPALPIDSYFPYFHLDRKFMHLGFHIYDVGFQSPNIEAAMPMVYMTTLLLIVIVLLLNIVAVSIRTRLRRKFKSEFSNL